MLAHQGGPRGFGGPPPGGPHWRGPGGGPGRGLGPLIHKLDLGDAQRAQVEQLTAAFEEHLRALLEQLRKAGGPFDALAEGTFDEAAVRSAAQARANAQVELEVAHARLLSQVYALLTTEQKARLAERRQQFEENRGARRPDAGPGDNWSRADPRRLGRRTTRGGRRVSGVTDSAPGAPLPPLFLSPGGGRRRLRGVKKNL